MDAGGLIRPCLLLVISICVCVVTGSPLGTSNIDCAHGSNHNVGTVDEGYTGDVELVNGIAAGSNVKLVPFFFDKHLEYLELSFTIGQTSATVRTKKPLSADALADNARILCYSVMCDDVNMFNNTRTLTINDLNNNRPVFQQKHYIEDVSETLTVGSDALRVIAVDGDSTPQNNRVTYSISPDPVDFTFTNGVFKLKNPLNYNVVQKYNFVVTASDNWGLNDTADVTINVVDFDNLNPYFTQNVYQAFIQENQAGPFRTIEPEAIKALDGDTGINMTLIYSISAVSPDKYRTNFDIDSSSGVVSVRTSIDREEMSSSVISVSIKAAQTDDPLKTADAQVSVTVEDVNDNPPQFDQGSYSMSLLENSPVDVVVFRAIVNDLDQGGFVGTLRILPESAPFSIGSDGTVRVKNSTALDRETTDEITFQIEAKEKDPPNTVVEVSVSVTLLDENDNSPVFTLDKYEGKVFANQTVGMQLVRVEAEDPDAGANGRIKYSIIFGNNDGYFSIDENNGQIMLAKTIPLEENKILEFPLYIRATDGDTTLVLTAMAEDHGEPPLNSTARVLVNLMNISVEGVAFSSSSYNFSLPENQAAGATVGRVLASSGSGLYDVAYRLKTHTDLFSIGASGAIETRAQLDKEEQEWFILDVEAVDTRTPPMTAFTTVTVQVVDVNESPKFTSEVYEASVFSIAPHKSPVIYVKASDPDVGEDSQLVYSTEQNSPFDVKPSSGLVYVVSVAGLADYQVTLEVKVTDPRGLHATTKVQVEIKRSASSSNVVVISLNRPANIVENKIQDLEKSLGTALGWTVDVINVSNATESRTLRTTARTSVSFIAVDGGEVVSSKAVREKLQSQSDAVTEELVKVFGDGVNFQVEPEPQGPGSNQTVVIAVGVLFGLGVPGLIVAVFVRYRHFVSDRFKRVLSREKSDKESIDISLCSKGDTQSHQREKKGSVCSQDRESTFEGSSETRPSQSHQRESDRASICSTDRGINLEGPSEASSSPSHQRESDRASICSADRGINLEGQVSKDP